MDAVVFRVNEKCQIHALNRAQPLLPMGPGQIERRTHEYERHETTSLFAALNVASGQVHGESYPRHRSREFRKFLDSLDVQLAPDGEVHVILDNYVTHKTPAVQRWLIQHPRHRFHFTPIHASWINQIERWLGLLTVRQIKRGVHTSVRSLQMAIEQFIAVENTNPKPFTWIKSADDILDNVARFAAGTLRVHGQRLLHKITGSSRQ